MVSLKLAQLSVAAVALASSALACVDYNSNLNYGNGHFNAALTDNGRQTCAMVNKDVGMVTAANDVVQLHCLDGYSASFNLASGRVHYRHGGFDGDFGTVTQSYPGNDGMYWKAAVWGC